MSERALRDEVADYARRLHARGWVANHDGNVTARASAGRLLATPTSTSKAEITAANLLVLDEKGEKLSGQNKPFGEIGLHLAIYARRPDVHAIVHAHPPYATALACSGSQLLERPFIAEAVVSIGPCIPTVPFAAPGKPAVLALEPYVTSVDTVLIANHGAMAWGATVEQAFLRLELVEHLARIAVEAERVGGVRPLPDAVLPALMEARRKAGLGMAASAPGAPSGPKTVVACAPAPGADVNIIAPGRSSAPELASIIREEIVRALKSR